MYVMLYRKAGASDPLRHCFTQRPGQSLAAQHSGASASLNSMSIQTHNNEA